MSRKGRKSRIGNASVTTNDSFSNPPARLGFSTPNLLESTQYPLTRLTKNYQLMNSLYRSHWVVRRIIDVVPEDMCKNWYKITSQIAPEFLDVFKRQERRTQIKAKILEGLKWGRLYGGAAGLIMIEGHEDILQEPLDLDEVMPNSFKGLMILDRWSGISPNSELVSDISDPDFGLPESYNITVEGSSKLNIHHSRILRFIGRDLPNWEKQAESYWGASEIEHIYDELRKRDNISWNIAQLTFNANLKVLLMDEIEQTLGVANAKAQQDLYNHLEALAHLMSNMGLLALGSKEKFETHQYAFSGLAEIYNNVIMDLSGAAEMPATKLFGRSPAGMNATGESDLQNYYDSIEEKQEAYLRAAFDKLLPVMAVSAWGKIPDDLDFQFNPCRRPTDKERLELAKSGADSIISAYTALLLTEREAKLELKGMSESTGMFGSISDKSIREASNEAMSGEEDMFGSDLESLSKQTADADWHESDHPRGNGGQFTSGGEASSSESGSKEPLSGDELKQLLGPEYKDVKGKEAVDKLLQEKKGHVKSAFRREDIGNIDLIWGDKRFGLDHIISRREEQGISVDELFSDISTVIERGSIEKNKRGTFEILHAGKLAVVSPEIHLSGITFLLTEYKTRKKP